MTTGLMACLLLAACNNGGTGTPEIRDARLGAPTGPNAALYFTALGTDQDDHLVGATTTVASEIQIHETTTGDDGTMSMAPVDSLELPAGGRLILEPGGYHLMLVDVERLAIGDRVEVTLIWDIAGEEAIAATVVDPADTMSHDG